MWASGIHRRDERPGRVRPQRNRTSSSRTTNRGSTCSPSPVGFPGNFRFVAKEELGRIPIFGRSWKRCGHVSIDRRDLVSAIGSLETAAERISRDKLTIVMFPEGTRSEDGSSCSPFKKGAFVLAIRAGVPLDSRSHPRDSRHHAQGSLARSGEDASRIHIGAKIETEGLVHEDRERLRDEAHAALSELMERTAPGSAPRTPESPIAARPNPPSAHPPEDTADATSTPRSDRVPLSKTPPESKRNADVGNR